MNRTGLKQALRPSNLPVLADKVVNRLKEPSPAQASAAAAPWLAARAVDSNDFQRQIAPGLVDAATAFAVRLHASYESRVPPQYRGMGGGGDYALLYLLTRKHRPVTVVETGVAQGWTSAAILTALAENESGRLWSSDFPYWRIESPEAGIGLMVEPEHHGRWTLLLKGDQANLPQILTAVTSIDLLHYDSDKSERGRNRAMALLAPRLSERALVVFDDVNDNRAFERFVEARPGWQHVVIRYDRKMIGLTGPGCHALMADR
jgi:predicted O-methyltransferase YrrM